MKKLIFLAVLIFLFATANISFGEGVKGLKYDPLKTKQFDTTQPQERELEIQKKERERLKKQRMKRLEEEEERKLDEAEGRFR
jgi:hypothetical protein